MIRKCRSGEQPLALFRRDKPLMTVKHELFIQQRAKRFEEDYAVLKKLGQGSFGLVYEVIHKSLGLHRALKIVRNTANDIYSTREQIYVLTQMDHPNVLKLYEYYEVKDCFYLITELFNGKQLLGELIVENSFTEVKAAEIALQILKALYYTHGKNIAHRDLKAENVLVNKKYGKWDVKVIDWGLGAIVGRDPLHRKCGTPEYAAPEIFQGNYNQQCDMWSFGVMIFVMLAGQHPFKGANFGQTMHRVLHEQPQYNTKIWSKISNEGKDLVKKLLVKDPKLRLTAHQALKHPWIKKSIMLQISPNQLSETLDRLREFRINNNLILATMNYIHNCLSTEEQRRELSEIFKYLDKNNDGVLSFEELVEGYTGVHTRSIAQNIVDEIFTKIDMNRTGKLEYNEFVTYAMLTRKIIQEDKLKIAFEMFDTNNDNRISINQTKEILFNGMQDLDEELVHKTITEIDENRDGFIDEQQFIKCLNNLSREFDGHIEAPLSFLEQCEKYPSPVRTNTTDGKNSSTLCSADGSKQYTFGSQSPTIITNENSDNSGSIMDVTTHEQSRINTEEESSVDTGKQNNTDLKHIHMRRRQRKPTNSIDGIKPTQPRSRRLKVNQT